MHSTKRMATVVALPLIALLLAGCSAGTTDTGSAGSGATSASLAAAAPVKAVSWYAKKYPTFSTKTFKGKGDDVISLPKGASKGILKVKHTGDANFIISVLDAKNQQTVDQGVNAIGNFKGSVEYGLTAFGKTAKTLKVKADGKWSITVSDFDDAAKLPASGHGDGVFKYSGPAKTVKVTHHGDANFIVEEYSDAVLSNLQINEIGNYSGKSLVDPGPAIVAIQADGKWTIK